MPKKSKKHRFHGTSSWRRKQEFQEGASEGSQPTPEESDHHSDLDDSQSEAECSKETASERKLRTARPTRAADAYYELK